MDRPSVLPFSRLPGKISVFLRDAGYDVVERTSAEAMTNAVLPATLRHACRFLRKIKKYGDEETFSGCKSTSGFVMPFCLPADAERSACVVSAGLQVRLGIFGPFPLLAGGV